MLSDRYRQLLTAYIDGELSSRQRRYVVRLLHRSEEARQLLQQLKADARALRQLPEPPLPLDFVGPVLRLIAERNLTPRQPRILKAAPTAAWVGPLASWAVAAAVLLALGVASYYSFVASLDQPPKTEMAQLQPEQPGLGHDREEDEPAIPDLEDKIAEPRKSSTPKQDRRVAVTQPKVVRKNDEKPQPSLEDKLISSPKRDSALAERVETFQFERVPDLLPVVVKLSDLDRLPARKKLIAELAKENAFRLELPCPNGSKAFERVQNAARTLHIGLLIDKAAQERLKLKWKISYVVYLENLTPEELAEFMRQIDLEDHKSAARKPAEVQLESLVLTRMNPANRKELSSLLGVDPLADAPPRPEGQSSAGQGSTPDSAKTAPQPVEQIALVLPYTPVRPSPGSDEIKHFLDSRKPARPGTVRALIVLRGS